MKDDLISLSKALIAIPSTKESPDQLEAVLKAAQSVVSEFPFKRFVCDGNPSLLIYNKWPENGKFHILLNGHLDVVPGKPEQFAATVEGDKLIGRGAIDMKAATAAEILAFKETAAKVDYPLALQLVTDEEIGGKKGVKYQISQGILTDFYLCGEYSDLEICCETKGVLWIKMTTKGKRAHGAYVWNGVNAITKLAKEIQSVSKIFPVPAKTAWKTTCNFGVISGGNTVNQVPDEASVTLDIRHVPEDSSSQLLSKIKSGLTYPDTQLEIMEDEPCNHADKNDPLVKQLAASIKQVAGENAKYVKFHGASDARYYSAAGSTAVDIGPTGEGLHSDYEWCSIKSLQTYKDILVKFLLPL